MRYALALVAAVVLVAGGIAAVSWGTSETYGINDTVGDAASAAGPVGEDIEVRDDADDDQWVYATTGDEDEDRAAVAERTRCTVRGADGRTRPLAPAGPDLYDYDPLGRLPAGSGDLTLRCDADPPGRLGIEVSSNGDGWGRATAAMWGGLAAGGTGVLLGLGAVVAGALALWRRRRV